MHARSGCGEAAIGEDAVAPERAMKAMAMPT